MGQCSNIEVIKEVADDVKGPYISHLFLSCVSFYFLPSLVMKGGGAGAGEGDISPPAGDSPPAPNRLLTNRLNGHTKLRLSNVERSLKNKKRVIKMLAVVVMEYFICWTPLYVINTWALFDMAAVYAGLGPAGILGCYSFAYVSCCCNPITYCFMNSNFRKAFLNVFGCRRNALQRTAFEMSFTTRTARADSSAAANPFNHVKD